MKWLTLLIALFTLTAHAGEATFNWIKPFPIFTPNADGTPAVVPPDWTIDEYRVKCVVTAAGQPDVNYTRIVAGGYDIETVTYTDLPNGDTTCIMTSFSLGNGLESIDSNSVTKFVMDATSPAPPTVFDFIPLVSVLGLPVPANQVIRSTSRINIAGNIYSVECEIHLNHQGKLVTVCER